MSLKYLLIDGQLFTCYLAKDLREEGSMQGIMSPRSRTGVSLLHSYLLARANHKAGSDSKRCRNSSHFLMGKAAKSHHKRDMQTGRLEK